MNIRQQKLPVAVLERIDDLCTDFERGWKSGNPTSIESVLAAQADPTWSIEREVLLAELISLEVDYQRRQGQSPTAQEYLERFAEYAHVIRDVFQVESRGPSGFEAPSIQVLGERFPELQILEFIGAGGMGAVYKARQLGLDRLVALKILPEEFGHDVKFALRFTREARTLAKLSHPNIVSVYEFGHVGDSYYFLMEYVDGSTLRDIVSARQLAPEQALAIVPHLCDALQYAHDKGVVHRDIKPENILLARNGAVKIADFGLSRILGNEGPQELLTGTHQVMGTPRYMAPEQLEGARNVDHRADIFSLGVVFYEMLTGELPVGRFAAPSQKVDIDVRLDEVVLRTLEKEPQRRYQHASDVKLDVQSITSGAAGNLPPTMVYESHRPNSDRSSLEQQELAGRLLLTRRQLLERVERSLTPLHRGQWLQVLFGIGLIILGVLCWTRNTQVPHRLVSGIILHVYGVLVISQALLVITRLRRIDYSKPIAEIRGKLDSLRAGYLRAGVLIGFIWWLMWIPVTVALGFDPVVHPNSLIPSLVIGVIGFTASVWWYLRTLSSKKTTAEGWKRKLAGESISAAYLALDEIESTKIY